MLEKREILFGLVTNTANHKAEAIRYWDQYSLTFTYTALEDVVALLGYDSEIPKVRGAISSLTFSPINDLGYYGAYL